VADSFFTLAHDLERRGIPFATATVVRIERPTSGKPGDRGIVTLDGELLGWVGGSCARPTVIKEGLACLADGRCRLIRLSPEPDDRAGFEGITDLSMTCFSGGTMEIFIEPNPPRPRLIVVGDQPVAHSLAELGRTMGYQIMSVGPASPIKGVEALATPDEIGAHVHPLTFVVVATHGDHDEIALEAALEAGAPYVGLVASRKRADSIGGYLKVRGLSEERLGTLRSPAGLDLGARTPQEIALSILAEIVQVGRSLDHFGWSEREPAAARRAHAVDPICGMSVEIASAKHVHVHSGTSYYFCCAACLETFAANPARHLG
jgi:xanthine dehydrogenase accessory factor